MQCTPGLQGANAFDGSHLQGQKTTMYDYKTADRLNLQLMAGGMDHPSSDYLNIYSRGLKPSAFPALLGGFATTNA